MVHYIITGFRFYSLDPANRAFSSLPSLRAVRSPSVQQSTPRLREPSPGGWVGSHTGLQTHLLAIPSALQRSPCYHSWARLPIFCFSFLPTTGQDGRTAPITNQYRAASSNPPPPGTESYLTTWAENCAEGLASHFNTFKSALLLSMLHSAVFQRELLKSTRR